jgi:hypothetical protein
MSSVAREENPESTPARSVIPYWEDPAYRHVSRRHREAAAAGDDSESVRYAQLMQDFVDGRISDETY